MLFKLQQQVVHFYLARACRQASEDSNLFKISNSFAHFFEADTAACTGINKEAITRSPVSMPRVPQRILRPCIVGPTQEAIVSVCGSIPYKESPFCRRRSNKRIRPRRCAADVI